MPWTPRLAAGGRIDIDPALVQVIDGDPFTDVRKRPGTRLGTVAIDGVPFRVYSAACDMPGCWCDSVLKPVRERVD